MSIPDATTTITILRPRTPLSSPSAALHDPWDGDDVTGDSPGDLPLITVAAGVRAVLGKGRFRGSSTHDGSSRMKLTVLLYCDPVDLRHEDIVVDDVAGDRWQVDHATARPSVEDGDEAHTFAVLFRVAGEV